METAGLAAPTPLQQAASSAAMMSAGLSPVPSGDASPGSAFERATRPIVRPRTHAHTHTPTHTPVSSSSSQGAGARARVQPRLGPGAEKHIASGNGVHPSESPPTESAAAPKVPAFAGLPTHTHAHTHAHAPQARGVVDDVSKDRTPRAAIATGSERTLIPTTARKDSGSSYSELSPPLPATLLTHAHTDAHTHTDAHAQGADAELGLPLTHRGSGRVDAAHRRREDGSAAGADARRRLASLDMEPIRSLSRMSATSSSSSSSAASEVSMGGSVKHRMPPVTGPRRSVRTARSRGSSIDSYQQAPTPSTPMRIPSTTSPWTSPGNAGVARGSSAPSLGTSPGMMAARNRVDSVGVVSAVSSPPPSAARSAAPSRGSGGDAGFPVDGPRGPEALAATTQSPTAWAGQNRFNMTRVFASFGSITPHPPDPAHREGADSLVVSRTAAPSAIRYNAETAGSALASASSQRIEWATQPADAHRPSPFMVHGTRGAPAPLITVLPGTTPNETRRLVPIPQVPSLAGPVAGAPGVTQAAGFASNASTVPAVEVTRAREDLHVIPAPRTRIEDASWGIAAASPASAMGPDGRTPAHSARSGNPLSSDLPSDSPRRGGRRRVNTDDEIVFDDAVPKLGGGSASPTSVRTDVVPPSPGGMRMVSRNGMHKQSSPGTSSASAGASPLRGTRVNERLAFDAASASATPAPPPGPPSGSTAFFVSAAHPGPMPAASPTRKAAIPEADVIAPNELTSNPLAPKGLGFGAGLGLQIGVVGYGRMTTSGSDDIGTVDGGSRADSEMTPVTNSDDASPAVLAADSPTYAGAAARQRRRASTDSDVSIPTGPPTHAGIGPNLLPPAASCTPQIGRPAPNLTLEAGTIRPSEDSLAAFGEDGLSDTASASHSFHSWKDSLQHPHAAIPANAMTPGQGRASSTGSVVPAVDVRRPDPALMGAAASSSGAAAPPSPDARLGPPSTSRKPKKDSIRMTATGSLQIGGFVIRDTGIEGTPDRPRARARGTSAAGRIGETTPNVQIHAGLEGMRVRSDSDTPAGLDGQVFSPSTTADAVTPAVAADCMSPAATPTLSRHSSAASAASPSQANFKDASVRIEVLGQGASGTVYKMVHVPTLTLVAAKMIPMFDAERRHSMAKELKALYANITPFGAVSYGGQLAVQAPCPHIVSFYDAFVDAGAGTITFVMEYLDGGSLQDIVDTGGCADEFVLAKISWRVLKGLEFIHSRRLIHRDIKPSNLLINHQGAVKIADFGIIREMNESLDLADTFVGTQVYMSPERIAGQSYGYTSDIWSFGLSILALALGKFPIQVEHGYWALLHYLQSEEPPSPPEGQFSPDFVDFIRQCLLKDPALRPDATELLSHPFLAGVQAAIEADTAAMAAVDVSQARNAGTIDDLKEVCRKVQEYRLRSAIKRKEKRLPLIPPERFEALGQQMGIPSTFVARCFNKYQRDYDTRLRELAEASRRAQSYPAAAAATAAGDHAGAARLHPPPATRRGMYVASRHASNLLETIDELDGVNAPGSAPP